jgi:hypothetical protein
MKDSNTKQYDFNVKVKRKKIRGDNIKHANSQDGACSCTGGCNCSGTGCSNP